MRRILFTGLFLSIAAGCASGNRFISKNQREISGTNVNYSISREKAEALNEYALKCSNLSCLPASLHTQFVEHFRGFTEVTYITLSEGLASSPITYEVSLGPYDHEHFEFYIQETNNGFEVVNVTLGEVN